MLSSICDGWASLLQPQKCANLARTFTPPFCADSTRYRIACMGVWALRLFSAHPLACFLTLGKSLLGPVPPNLPSLNQGWLVTFLCLSECSHDFWSPVIKNLKTLPNGAICTLILLNFSHRPALWSSWYRSDSTSAESPMYWGCSICPA